MIWGGGTDMAKASSSRMDISKNDDSEADSLVKEYKAQLNEDELKTLSIAEEHLGTSFDIDKSIGFLEWSKDRRK